MDSFLSQAEVAPAKKEDAPEVLPTAGFVPAPPAKRFFRHKWAKWGLVIGAVIVIAVVVELWRSHAANEITYTTVPVERGSIQTSVTTTGTVNAVVDVQVGSQVSGNIKALYADFNTKVKKGQLVALIDPELFQAAVDQAQAGLDSAKSAVVTATAQVVKANSDLSGSMASEKSAESIAAKDQANAVNANAQWLRMDGLFNEGVISKEDHDAAKAASDSAAAQVTADQALIDAAKQTVISAQAEVSVVKGQLSSAQAQQAQAQASLEQAKINLQHTQITAPVDGTVISRNMDVGQTVAASLAAPTIFQIAQDLTKMQVDTNVDESDVANIIAGQTATFTVDAYPTTPFSGVVTDVRKAPIITQNVVTYDVVISVSNPDLKLFPGMTANARILTLKVDDTLKVPNAVLRLNATPAILQQLGLPPAPAGKQNIYVVRGGKVLALAVTYGLSDGRSTAVTSTGLQVGDQVVERFATGATAATTTTSTPAPGTTTSRRGPTL
ncbi:MAG: efflux RND transporter periplasmic adaptor subunit [Candidatus Acidiferrales bacterium]